MRIACNIPIQIAVKQLLSGLFLFTKATPGKKVGRGLQVTSHSHKPLCNVRFFLNCSIPLGVGDNHRITETLKLKDGPLVVGKIALSSVGVKLKEKLVAPVKTQVGRPLLHPQLHELRVRHLKAHLQGKAIRMSLQLAECRPHSVVVKIRITAMGCADNTRHTSSLGSLEHRKAHGKITSAVINAGKYMAMDVSHDCPLASLVKLRRARGTAERSILDVALSSS